MIFYIDLKKSEEEKRILEDEFLDFSFFLEENALDLIKNYINLTVSKELG